MVPVPRQHLLKHAMAALRRLERKMVGRIPAIAPGGHFTPEQHAKLIGNRQIDRMAYLQVAAKHIDAHGLGFQHHVADIFF